jgi:hypothetical protein
MTKHLFLLIFIGGFMLFPLQGNAETPFPKIHEPEGKKCVQPEDEMRRNHMNYILHQRDETVHNGIRTEKYSLSKCIDCHIEPNENGEVASHDDEEHFCTTCHTYASVQIDCFECHADKPEKFIKRGKKNATLKQELHELLASKGVHNE